MNTHTMAHSHVNFDVELTTAFAPSNPLEFDGYTPPLPTEESVRFGIVQAPMGDYMLIECAFERAGGTMGVHAGESVVRAFQHATTAGMPVGMIISSGGARLQEGFLALMQMGRTSSAAAAHKAAQLRSAAVFRSPTTGGVFASWGNSADMRAASPGAIIGFGGPRVVEAVTGTRPPTNSHNAEAAYRDRLLDALIPEDEQQEWLEQALGVREAPAPPASECKFTVFDVHEDPWDALMNVRRPEYPSGMDWVSWLAEEWLEMRAEGPCFRAGLARINGHQAVVVAMHRDKAAVTLPTPGDFRFAQRAIRLADTSGLPLVTIIDTPGADPSPTSETQALAREISHTLLAMATLRSPSVSICVGEGGSGGAMALAHTDSLFLLESSVFAVIGPDAGAAVLYRDPSKARALAGQMRIGAGDLERMGVVDGVLAQDVILIRERLAAAFNSSLIGMRVQRPASITTRVLELNEPRLA